MQKPDLPPKPIELMGEKTMEIQDCGKWLRCMRFGKKGEWLGWGSFEPGNIVDKVLRMLILKGISTTATCCFYMVKVNAICMECSLPPFCNHFDLVSILQTQRINELFQVAVFGWVRNSDSQHNPHWLCDVMWVFSHPNAGYFKLGIWTYLAYRSC